MVSLSPELRLIALPSEYASWFFWSLGTGIFARILGVNSPWGPMLMFWNFSAHGICKHKVLLLKIVFILTTHKVSNLKPSALRHKLLINFSFLKSKTLFFVLIIKKKTFVEIKTGLLSFNGKCQWHVVKEKQLAPNELQNNFLLEVFANWNRTTFFRNLTFGIWFWPLRHSECPLRLETSRPVAPPCISSTWRNQTCVLKFNWCHHSVRLGSWWVYKTHDRGSDDLTQFELCNKSDTSGQKIRTLFCKTKFFLTFVLPRWCQSWRRTSCQCHHPPLKSTRKSIIMTRSERPVGNHHVFSDQETRGTQNNASPVTLCRQGQDDRKILNIQRSQTVSYSSSSASSDSGSESWLFVSSAAVSISSSSLLSSSSYIATQ